MRLHYKQEPVAKAASYVPESGFGENFTASLGLTVMEDLPSISRMIPTVVESQRKKLINDYVQSGDIPASVFVSYGRDYNGMAGYAKDVLNLPGFVTDEDYEEKRKAEYKMFRDYSHSVFERATGMGTVGQLMGAAAVMPLDPVYAVSAVTGYGVATTAIRAGLMAMAFEGAVEAVAQVPKMAFKEEIGAQYSGAQAATEVLFTALGAGAIAGIAKRVSLLFGGSRVPTPKDLTVGDVLETLEDLAKTTPEVEPVLNTLRHADPEANLMDALQADEAVDIRRAAEGPLNVNADTVALKVEEAFQAQEEKYLQRQPIEVSDRVKLLEKTSTDKIDKFTEEMRVAKRQAKKATKKYNKAKQAASKAEASSAIKEDSIAGAKAKKAAVLARDKANVAEQAMTDAVEKEAASKKLYDESVKTGVPRGTPTKAEPEPDLRHPMVREADDIVVRTDDTIKIMEDCF